MSLNMHFSFFALSPFTKNNSFVWFRAWNITKTRWKIDFYDQQWYHATLRIVQVFFSHRGTTAVYDNSIFQLSFSKIMKVKIKRIDKHSSFLLFYVSIRRQITRIIVLSLLSRLHETALRYHIKQWPRKWAMRILENVVMSSLCIKSTTGMVIIYET